VALHAAEEESIEELKKWWEDNGTAIIIVVASVALGWGGWTFWQNSRISIADAASDIYEEVLQLAAVQPGIEVPQEDKDRIATLTQTLKTDHTGTVYAKYAAFFAAQQAVNSNELDKAEQELRWILDNVKDGLFSKTDSALVLTTNLRLARVLLAKGESQQALDLIDAVNPESFEAEFAELRGDVYVALGRMVDARDAYTAAREAGSGSTFLQMKLDELANES
jgi:predicted negative regulator of RcsB-dependent stress response